MGLGGSRGDIVLGWDQALEGSLIEELVGLVGMEVQDQMGWVGVMDGEAIAEVGQTRGSAAEVNFVCSSGHKDRGSSDADHLGVIGEGSISILGSSNVLGPFLTSGEGLWAKWDASIEEAWIISRDIGKEIQEGVEDSRGGGTHIEDVAAFLAAGAVGAGARMGKSKVSGADADMVFPHVFSGKELGKGVVQVQARGAVVKDSLVEVGEG